MTGYLIHCGMPKTGTSVLQACLAGSELQLRRAGVLYPAAGRTGNGHHAMAIALREEGAEAPARQAEALRAEVARTGWGVPRLAVCSSEQFSNLFSAARLERLLDFLAALGRDRVRAVVVFREYTGYIESMFLQVSRFQDGRGAFDAFLRRMIDALPDLLLALLALRSELGERFEVLAGAPGFDVLAMFDRLLGLEPGSLTPASRDRETTSRPTLKVQSVMSDLPRIEERAGFRISRRRLMRLVRRGGLAFEGDVAAYTVYPPGARQAAAGAMIPVMRDYGFPEMADLMEPQAAAADAGLPWHTVESGAVTARDVDVLRALRDRLED